MGSLAQLVEHRTFNPMVERSNRSRPTIFKKACIIVSLFFSTINLRISCRFRALNWRFIVATIQRVINSTNVSYRVFIRKRGFKTLSKTFPTKKLAKQFALRMESDATAMLSIGGMSISRVLLIE